MLKILISITPDVIKSVNSKVIPAGMNNIMALTKLTTDGSIIRDALVSTNVNDSFINMEILNSTNNVQAAINHEAIELKQNNYYAIGNNPNLIAKDSVNLNKEIRQYNNKTNIIDFSIVDKQEYAASQRDLGYNYVEVMSIDLSMYKVLHLDDIPACPYCKSKVFMTPLRNMTPKTNENIICIIMNGMIIQMNSDFDTNSSIDKYNITVPGLTWEPVYNFVNDIILPMVSDGIVILDVIDNDEQYEFDIAQFKSLTEIDDTLGFLKIDCIIKALTKVVLPDADIKECGFAQIQKDLAEYNEKINQGLIKSNKKLAQDLVDPFDNQPVQLMENDNKNQSNKVCENSKNQVNDVYNGEMYKNLPGLNEDKIKMMLSQNNVPEKVFENFPSTLRETFLKRNMMYINDYNNDHSLSQNNVNDYNDDHSSTKINVDDCISETRQEFSGHSNNRSIQNKNVHIGESNFLEKSQTKTDSQKINYNKINLTLSEWDTANNLFKGIITELDINTSSTLFYTIYKGGLSVITKLFNNLKTESVFGIVKFQRYDGSDTNVELLSPPRTIESDHRDIIIVEDLIDSGITMMMTLDYLDSIHSFEDKRISIFCIHASAEALMMLNHSRFNVNIFYYNLKHKNDWIVYPWE